MLIYWGVSKWCYSVISSFIYEVEYFNIEKGTLMLDLSFYSSVFKIMNVSIISFQR